jgi:hypothetical protein
MNVADRGKDVPKRLTRGGQVGYAWLRDIERIFKRQANR